MKHLSLTWTEGTAEVLKKFHFIFHLALKDVQKDLSIEELIVKQHKGLKGNNVHPREIKAIMAEQAKQKVLIILDGHDEYKRGNEDIDDAIKRDCLRNCWIIVTSRETEELAEIRQYMDAEAKITGFDASGVEEYATKYLGSKEKCDELLRVAEDSEIIQREYNEDEDDDDNTDYGILSIPIMLHMICCLFLRKASLPRLKTGILSAIAERCIDWETIRNTGKKRVQTVERAIVKLGKLAMKGLQQKHLQQSFDKVYLMIILL